MFQAWFGDGGMPKISGHDMAENRWGRGGEEEGKRKGGERGAV